MTFQFNPQAAAQLTASQGRGDDTELVHMSKQEVAALQALAQKHGIRSLTRNPSTGLVEAGWLSSILPAVAGIGLAAFAPELAPLIGDSAAGFLGSGVGAGLAVGGVDALATGSLKQGLLAGLGAYGGSNLAQGLGAGVMGGANPVSAQVPSATGFGDTPGMASSTVANAYTPATSAVGFGDEPVSAATQNATTAQAAAATPPTSISSQLASNFKNGPFDSSKYNMLFNSAALAAPALGQTQQAAPPSALQNLQNTVRPYSFSQTPTRASGTPGDASTPFLNQQYTALPTYVAGSGISTLPTSNLAGGGLAHGMARGESLRGTLGMLHGVEKLSTYAKGGISNLGSYSDGGQLLRGPGDGVSDSIPAQIGEHQPARLAEGEFVVPARIVSELGNGSTNAGAQKLYQMLNRIQEGRGKTMGGKSAYANDTKADKHLPA